MKILDANKYYYKKQESYRVYSVLIVYGIQTRMSLKYTSCLKYTHEKIKNFS